MVHINYYYNILTWYHKYLACSNWIFDPAFIHWVWKFWFLALCFVLYVLRKYIGGNNDHYFLLPICEYIIYTSLAPSIFFSSWLSVSYVNLLSVSATAFPNLYIWWIFGLNSSRNSLQSITIWYSLRVAR